MPTQGIDESQLRDCCEQLIDHLRLPHRFSTGQLCEAISRLRGKPIILKPLRTVGAINAPCGIRLETANSELLFYEEGTSVHHQRHILTHELMHVYRDHPGSLEVHVSTAHALGLNPTLVLRMSGRTSYSSADEREAEMMATIIRQRIYRERQIPSPRPRRGPDSWDALFAQPMKKGPFRSR